MLFLSVLALVLTCLLPYTANAYLLSETVNRDVWTNLPSFSLPYLIGAAGAYDEGIAAQAPTLSSILANGLEATGFQPYNYEMYWGMRVRGYLVPNETASYTFWIEGDDSAQFWLSTNSSEGGKFMVVDLTQQSDIAAGYNYGTRKSSPIALTAGGVYYLELIYKDAAGQSRVTVAWSMNPTHSPTEADIIPASVVSSLSKGAHYAATYGPSRTLDRSYWTGLSTAGESQIPVSTLTSLADYPDNPTGSDLVGDGFVFRDFARSNLADLDKDTAGASCGDGQEISALTASGYGQRIRGYIAPAESGNYTFFIQSRGPSELRLSRDGGAAQPICREAGQGLWCCYDTGSEMSAPQSLQAGQLYYFELYHVADQLDCQDFLNVAWRLNNTQPPPDNDHSHIIPASALHAYSVPLQTTTATTTTTTSTSTSTTTSTTVSTSTLTSSTATTGTSTTVGPSCGSSACLLSETVNRDVWVWTDAAAAGSSLQLHSFKNLTEAPSSSSVLANGLEATGLSAQNFDDDYGQRIRGFLVPDQTARYTFWIEGDDTAELWLSTNRTESAKVKVANLTSHSEIGQGYNFNVHDGQKSSPIPLTAGEVYYLEILHKAATAGDRVTVVWSTDANHNPDSLGLPSQDLIPASVLSSFSKGADYAAIYGPSRTLDRSYWTGLSGSEIEQLTGETTYPNEPTGGSDIVGDGTVFRSWATKNLGEWYGQRIRGYIVPPESGSYTFYINSRPQSEFRLSSDSNPDNAVPICWEWSPALATQYTYWTTGTAKSSPQSLQAWQLYYFELYHSKPISIEDFVNVAWRRDGGVATQSDIIPASALHEFLFPIQTSTATMTTSTTTSSVSSTSTTSTTSSTSSSSSSSSSTSSSTTSTSSSTSSYTSTTSSSSTSSSISTSSTSTMTRSSTTSTSSTVSSTTSSSSSTSSLTMTATSTSSTSRSTSTTSSMTISTSSSTTSSSSWTTSSTTTFTATRTSSITTSMTTSSSSSSSTTVSKTSSTTSSKTSTTSSVTTTSTSSGTSSTSTETTATTTSSSTVTSTVTTTSSSSSTATSTSTSSSTSTRTTTLTSTSSITSRTSSSSSSTSTSSSRSSTTSTSTSLSSTSTTSSSSSGTTTATSTTTTPSPCYNTPLVVYGGNHSHCLGLRHGEECDPRCVPGHRMVGGTITCVDGTFSVEGACLEDALADALGSQGDAAVPTRAVGVVLYLEVSVGPQSAFTYSWVQENYQLVLESIASILAMDPRFISLEIVLPATDPVGRLLQSADSSFQMRVRSMLPADLNTSSLADEETEILAPLRRKFSDLVWVPEATGGYHTPALFLAIARQAESAGVPVPEGLKEASLSAGSATDHASDMSFMPPVWILDPWSSCSCPGSVQTRTIHCTVDHLASCDGGDARPLVDEPCFCPEETSALGLAVAVGGGVAGLICLLVCCFVCRRLSRPSEAGSARLLDNKAVTVNYVIKHPSKSLNKAEEKEHNKVHVVWDVDMDDLEALLETQDAQATQYEISSSCPAKGEESVAPVDSEASTDLACSMFSHGDPIEYFSRTHKCWLVGTVRVKFVQSEQGIQASYIVHLDSSGQWRHDVSADLLRIPFRDKEPVDIFCHRNGGSWVPGFVCCDEVTRAKCQAYGRARYHVLLQAPASTILEEVPAERLRRRFPPGCSVKVFRAQRGWVHAKVSDAQLNNGDSLVSVIENEEAGPEMIPERLAQCDLEQLAQSPQ